MSTYYPRIAILLILLSGLLLGPAQLSAVNQPGRTKMLKKEKDKRVRIVLKDKKKKKRYKAVTGNIVRMSRDSIYLINYSSGKIAAEQGYEKPLAIPISRIKKIKLYNYRGKARKRSRAMTIAGILTIISFFTFLIGDRKLRSIQGEYQSGAFWIGIYGMVIFGIITIINLVGWMMNNKTIKVDDALTTEQLLMIKDYIL